MNTTLAFVDVVADIDVDVRIDIQVNGQLRLQVGGTVLQVARVQELPVAEDGAAVVFALGFTLLDGRGRAAFEIGGLAIDLTGGVCRGRATAQAGRATFGLAL